MSDTPPLSKLTKPRIALMAVIDLVFLAIGVALFVWLQPRDTNAAVGALISAVVFAGFFNLVIVLVSLKP